MRTGFVTTTGMHWRDSLELAGRIDVDFVELWQDGLNSPQNIADETEEIAALADAQGVDLLVHLPFPFDLGSQYREVRTAALDALKRSITVAAAAGAEKGVVHPVSGAYTGTWSDDRVRETILDSIRVLHDHGAEQGFEVCPENIFESRYTINEFDELLTETPAGMTLDTGHARISGVEGDDLLEFVDSHASDISHVHLNETRRGADEHLPVGMGDMPIEALVDRFEAASWDGTVSMEIMSGDPEYIEISYRKLRDRLGM